ncbi:MAG: TIR domain-containing protein, partial [Planctomycetes bacterium]|nr:TIR domain-containing protein [Planctomycetota bacterium]
MQFEYDVFLSYSSKDKKTVHTLAERLRGDGLRVWLDAWVIQPGEMIGLAIQHGVEKSRTLLMCMSPAYFESEWGALEHHSMLFRDPTNAERRFIPLLIEDCAPPDIIAQFAHIDWRTISDEAYETLLVACRLDKPETEEPSVPVRPADQSRMVLEGHANSVWSVSVTPDGKTVVSGSVDKTLKVWDLETGQCRATLRGHTDSVSGVAVTPDGKRVVSRPVATTLNVWSLETTQCIATLDGAAAYNWGVAMSSDGRTLVSGASDNALGVWDLETKQLSRKLGGHTRYVRGVAISDDGRIAVSGSADRTLKVWDLETGQCRYSLEGHTSQTDGVAIAPDVKTVVSGSADNTLRVWDLETGQCRATFEGHTGPVFAVAVTPDGKRVVSGSGDNTVKVWDLATGRCSTTFEGHTDEVYGLAVTPDGKTVISGSADSTLRVWDLPAPDMIVEDADAARYTNAKVVLVGESGVGKTGLAMRLCQDRWKATESTHGMVVERLELPSIPGSEEEGGLDREVWLWDFAGQPDYRLIHQLYMDQTALGVLVFDPQDDNPFENIGYWDKALSAATKHDPAKLLVAGRCDRGGITISRKRFEEFVREQGFADFLITGAKTGDGCKELQAAIAKHIPWERLPWTATSRLFKTLKDAILTFTEEDAPLARLSELRQRLQLSLPEETIDDPDLRAVVGLMQSQGVVQMLGFGD